MNVTIIGTGYVGLVTGVCLSNVGNKVICLDIDENKIKELSKGLCPIYEPGLKSKLISGLKSKNLIFTSNSKYAIEESSLIFIAVGTPSLDDGSTDLGYVESASKVIAENLNDDKIVITKSTVPVGTTHIVRGIIEKYSRGSVHKVDLINNPEFLKEGKAIKDFEYPDRIVIGYEDEAALNVLRELYQPFNLHHDKIIAMDIKSSELTKYAANAMLATKISFINEMANLCEIVGANINSVRTGIGSDSRIGFDFIYPGVGFGGSCFPKDLKSIKKTSEQIGYRSKIISAVIEVNEEQKVRFSNRIINYFSSHNKVMPKVAIWGLSFKPETDDVRESPSIEISKRLLESGFYVNAFDPIASKNFDKAISHENLFLGEDMYEVLDGVDAVILCTEWNQFKSPDYKKMKSLMKSLVIFDGKNIYNRNKLEKLGFEHFEIGVKS